MTISPSILEMSAEKLAEFVALRRDIRHSHNSQAVTKRKRAKSVAALAKELGVGKNEVLKVLDSEVENV